MSIALTNRTKSQALRGQTVKITLNAAEANGYLAQVSEGDLCTNGDGLRIGLVSKVDYDGICFWITPIAPNLTFESNTTPGYVNAPQSITIDV